MLSAVPSMPADGDSEGPGRAVMNGRSAPPAGRPEVSLTFQPQPGESAPAMVHRMARTLEDIAVVDCLIFGSTRLTSDFIEAIRKAFPAVDWPVTWADGESCHDRRVAGIQVVGIAGGSVERIRLDGKVVGSVFEHGGARHCVIGGIGPGRLAGHQGDQTKQTLERLEAVLAQAGFAMADVVRTWFFLEDILSWYPEFNRVRTGIYSGVRFRTGSLPASTGVGAKNPDGAALSLRARAIKPLNGSPAAAFEVASPLQCPAPAYGSSFSRAMEIATATGRQLLVSGTASIAPGGRTLWPDDVIEQVALTMKIVEALLASRGYRLEDVTRSVAYFKHRAYLPVFTDWCRERRVAALPVIKAHCDICRDDLAFEFEADAAKTA